LFAVRNADSGFAPGLGIDPRQMMREGSNTTWFLPEPLIILFFSRAGSAS
jgi:hypothetical protein